MFLLKCNLTLLCVLICCSNLSSGIYHTVTQKDWEDYKDAFPKNYTDIGVSEAYAQYYFRYNMGLIRAHNAYYDRNQRSHKLRENQFTDMRLVTFNALFPAVQQPLSPNLSPLPQLAEAANSFDMVTTFGINVSVEDQGVNCNSGWAYAAAKSVELLSALQMSNPLPGRLSAQNLIDCAGQGSGCTNQVPHTAFDFLTRYQQDLHTEADYKNNINGTLPGMCVVNDTVPMMVVNLGKYSQVVNADETILKKVLFAGYPIVVEFNPTSFDFMHYGEGVFQAGLASTRIGSHFMVLLGYGNDAKTGLDYWLCLNSFGERWGERGFIKIAREQRRSVFRSAIFPLELA